MMKNLYSRLCVCKWLLFSVFFSMTVSSWAQNGPTVTPAFDQICRDEPVSVSITANSPFHAGDTLQWWIASSNDNGNNPTRWTKYKQSTSTTLIVDKMPDGYGNNMYVWVTDYKEDCPDGMKNKAAHVRLKPNDQCPNIQCRETATGDLTTFGTDFTPNSKQETQRFTGNDYQLEEYFPNNVHLKTHSPNDAGNIVSQSYIATHGYDGDFPDADIENYYLDFTPYPNTNQIFPYDLKFETPDYKVGVNDVSFNIVTRLYYSVECNTGSGDYMFKAQTTTGGELTNTKVTVVVTDMQYPDSTYHFTYTINNSVTQPYVSFTGRSGFTGMPSVNYNQGEGTLKGEILKAGHTYKIDCIFHGKFAGKRSDYTFEPMFYFPTYDDDDGRCNGNKYLIDYIGYETQNVCITPRSACVGDWVKVSTTGFLYDAVLNWQWKPDKNSGFQNIPADAIEYLDDHHKEVRIKMTRTGSFEFRAISNLDANEVIPFTMTGEDCESLISPSIQGDPLFCVSNSSNKATYQVMNTESLDWMSGEKKYNWKLIDPTGVDVTSYLNRTEGESVTITFPSTAKMSADYANKPYKLSMTPTVGTFTYDNYKKTVEIIVNRTPDLSDVIMDIPEVCPAIEKTDTIVLRNAEGVLGNSFKWYAQNNEYKEGLSDLLKPDSLEVDFGHKNFCNSASDVNIPIKYVSENNGCKDSLTGMFHVAMMNAPQIVCPADTVCALDENCEYHGYVVVPEVSSSVDCGDSVKIIEWVRPGLPDTVVSVGDVLDLPKGDNLFVYKIVDNCNHVGSCTRTVSVKDMTNPEVVCPPDTTIYLERDNCYITPKLPIATGSDNCSNMLADLEIWYSTPLEPTAKKFTGNEYYQIIDPNFRLCDDNYIYWFAVDAAGNKSEVCRQNITLADSFPPRITCPEVEYVDLTSSCEGSVGVSAPNVYDNAATCSWCNADLQVALYYSLDDGASYTQWTKTNGEKLTLTSGPDTLHVLWVAVDYFNNHSDTCDQVIVFRDMADPEIVCPDDVTAYAHISCDEEVEIGLATANDNCERIDSILYSLDGGAFVDANDSKVSVTVHVGSHTVTWKAVDVNGRSATCTQNVDLLDSLGIEKHCPTEPNAVINTCTDLTWAEVLAQLSASQKATMGSTDCSTGDVVSIDPTMFYKSQTATAYEPMIPSTNLSMDTLYDIKWLFEKSGEDVSTMKDSCFSTVLLTDKSDPITHCENIETVTLNPKGCDTIYTVVPPTGVFSDACTDDADLQYVFYLDGRGEFSYGTTDSMTFRLSNGGHWITWAVLDEHGNVSDTCGHAIKVVDTIPPTIECAPIADIKLEITTACDTALSIEAPTVTDACDTFVVYYRIGNGDTAMYHGAITPTLPKGETVIKWFAQDTSGNISDTCYSTYTVTDVAAPKIDCPSDTAFKLYQSCDTTFTLTFPRDTDNCGVTNRYYRIGTEDSVAYTAPFSHKFLLGETTITWISYDATKNRTECVRHYSVTDSSSIMISCPKNDNLTLDVCEDMAWSEVKSSLTGDYTATATRTDCQNGVNETLTPTFYYKKQSEGESAYVALTDASTFGLDIAYDVKWMFEKGGGDLEEMKDSCISHILLTDTTAPTANCNIVMPDLEPYGCDTLYLLEAPIGAFHDNCTPDDQLLYRYAVDTAEFVHFEDNIGGNKIRLPIGSHEVFWYAEDEHGNKSDTCSYTLVVKDILPPTVECETYGIPTLEVTQRCDTTFKIGAPKVTDCDTFNIYYRMGNGDERLYSDSLLVTFAVGDTLVKWYAKDTTGNVSDTCFAKYTVKDVAKPVITCPADNFEWKLRFHCDSTIVLEEPTASDNCSNDIYLYYKIGDEDEALYPSSGVSYNFPLGSTNVRWRAVDPTGNENTCTVVYTLKDSSGINISCPAEPNLTIDVCSDSVWSFVKTYLKGDYAASARQMDCAKGDSTDLTPTFFYKKTSESDNSYVALVDASRFVLDENYDIKWLFSKEGENATTLLDSCISHVILTDTTAPSSDCDAMKDIVLKPITCDTSYQFGKPLGVFDDICGEENLTYYYKLDDASDFVQLTDGVKNLLGSGTHKVVWRVEDAHHNVSKTCEQIVSVLDTIPPTIECAPIADIKLEITTACDTAPSIEAPTVTDACDTFVVYYRIGNGDTAMYHGAITPTLPIGETVIKWFAQDTSGNISDTCYSTYTVTDVAAPIFDCPSDTAFKLYHNCDTTFSIPFPIVNDNCDVTQRYYRFGSEDSVAYTEPVEHRFSLGETTITWIAYDAAGNKSVCERKYSVTDNTSITLSCPSQDNVVIDTCGPLSWNAVLSLYSDDMKALATRLDCANNGNVIRIEPAMYYKKASELTYAELNGTTELEYNTLYDLRWIFEKSGENMEELHDSCDSKVILRDTSVPTRNCEMMQDIVLKPIACDSIGYVIEKPDGVFDDNCDESNLTYYFKMDDDATFTEFTGSNGRDVTNGTHTVVWKVADKMGNESDTCWQTITIIDTVAPTITCPADTSIALSTGCEVDVTLRPAVPEDNCGPDSVYYSFDNVKFEALSTLTSTLDKHLSVGSYTVSWFTVDIHGVHSDTCQQKVSILDDHAIDIDCPTNPEDGPFIVEACTDLPWKDLNDSLTALNMNASASYTECATSSVVPIDSIIMKVSKSGENNWSVMDDDYVIDYNTAYDIRWIFVKAGDNLVTKSDSCFLSVLVKDTTAPDFNCDDIDPDSVVYIAHGVCELPYSDITLNKYTAHDNCDGDIVGILSTSKNLADSVKADDVFKVGTLYHLYWVFEDKTGNNVSCDQLLMLNSDLKPLFNCDSLKNSPITKLLHDACVTDFADLAITTPIAYDACTKDPIMGVGHRKSGEAMNGSYAVGRDTIVWVFKSIYSTALDSCEQYIFIRSDKKLDFDCDSLNKAVIDTVLQGVCEIDSASLNFTAPFALDVCTNDTIWGVGVRKSGEPMDGIYKVGRDTISWTFISEYSTDTVVCDQYIYIKSDKDLLFDCDSLNNAPIERILHDVCEIDSAGLNMIVPFALDACTNDTIWGVGVRKSGEPMGGTYKVGRDTISWTFISEYSTDTVVCEQFIYISSDKKLDFDCDSLNKAVIERVLHGVCETDSVGMNFTAPFALDACTNDTIWGVGARKSGEPMNGTYKVGRDTITWTFISEYSTDTVVCDQYLYIQSDKDLLFDCDSLNNAPIERVLSGVCETDSASLNFTVPFALDACTNDTIWGVGVRKSGEPMNGTYKVGRDTITWTFISEYSTDTVVCDQYLFIQSDKDLLFDCDSLNNAPIERVLSGVCETDSASLNFTVPFALDACTKDTIWGVGVRKSGEPMNGVYKVGRDTISWTFIGEYSTDTVVCDQYVYIQSDIKPKFDCDSLHNAPIERVLNGVCEIDSAGLNMIVPFALDACTNDTIWGRGSRTSGEPMGGTYKVGRDTIIWVFDSEYSIANDTCEQYIFIQSDLKPKFDCDSLHESPIHKVLVDTCIVSPADLSVNTPFALDACTNDTIWGVGTRKSGKLMTDNYQVGRDTIVWVFDSEYSTSNDTCEQYVFIQSNIKPIFDCDSLKNAKIEKVLEDVCEISAADLNVNIPFALDACTNDTVWGVGTRTSGREMDASYVVGHDTIVWKFISEFSTDSAVCEQYVFIQSNKGLEFDCDSLKNTPITRVLHGVCEVDSATLNFIVPFAMDGCMNDTVWGVGYRKSGEPMGGTYKVGRDTIVWKFSSEFVTDELICEQPIFIQSDLAPKFDCDSLKKEVIDTVLHGVCEIDSASLNFNIPFALDACTNDTVWGVGTRTSGLSMGDPYKVGRDTIVWTFTSEFSTESSVCEQYIFIQSDLAPVVDCDSLKANPIEKDLHGVCEISAADLNVNIPFALDACMNDTIWGVGTRTSGLAMDGIYKVGRDTIIWKFKSEFSTDSTLCEQYLLIRSDLQPVVDCDSLKNAVIDTVLHEVCEIEAADFNIIVPFALDACTNDTIWGEGSRTSGLDMSASYHVGRDTIVWRFVSPYSTETTICEQPVFVRSDKLLEFDCDSLKNAPIERVLEGVCEIAASELDVNTPYAVDACTNEKIYGVGTRTSGREMDDAYVVGRDTIVWTFISEFSTDTVVCEQPVFIQSDMAPKFNCDSLKQEVIDTVLHGVCEISAADLNIHTPVAFDACTNDSVLGVGYRKSGKEMTDNYPVGRDTIVWVFDSEYSTLNDTCEQYVYIQSDMKPSFDCDSLHNAPITKVLSGVCSISSVDLNVATPFALDACTKDTVWGVGYRTSGKSMADDYEVGHDTIVWVFDSEFSTNSDTCEQYVFIQSDLAPKFDCDSLKNSPIEKVLNGVCEISAADLNVNIPFALDACTNDTIWGVGRRTSGREMDDAYVVGHDTIVWTFTSVYSTTAADCEQYVFIQSDLAPKFDCDSLKDTVLYIAMNQCTIPAGQFVMVTPVAKDACTDEDVVGVPSRSDSLALEDAYPVGVTTLTWTFTSPLSTTPLSCSMTVTVLDTFPPVPNCDDLDTIHADITVASLNKTFTTYEEAVKAGLVTPTVEDLCDGTITATGVREDGSPLEGNFEIGNTTVVWTFTDNSGNSAICTQIVKVEDHGADTLFCPGVLDGSRYVCLEDVPAGYDSYEAFKAAGGSFTTESKIVEGSFRYTDVYDGDSCSMVVTRIYMVTDTRGDVDSCQEIIYVKDTVAPKFDFVLRDTILSCEDTIFSAETLTATDNCDGAVNITLIEENDRSKDVNSCDYYNYNITRMYIASDRCGNRDTMVQNIFIRDTVAPKFNYPDNWNNPVLAKSLKGCEFEVPDFTVSIKSMLEDNCSENGQLTVKQVPAPGSSIKQSMDVWIYVYDMCGNMDSTSKFVRVQLLNSIVSVSAPSRDTCVFDELGVSLASQDIRFASGIVEEMRADGTIRKRPSVFCFDYYRGEVSRENLMYSENPKTYSSEFDVYNSLYGNSQVVAEELTKLHQRSESGYYSFVAMDTTTGCSDTATAYINVLERPKVKIVSAQMPVCEGNYINLAPYLQCVDSMGASITAEYWMVDTLRFDPDDSIMGKVSSEYNGKLISYYAENRCGSTSSLNSHVLLNCYDDSLTTKDSLNFLNGDSTSLTMLRLNQIYSRDSILLDVHTRFNPDSIVIETEPHDPARIWRGESVTLALNTKYDYHYLVWHKVVGKYDMENYNSYEGEGFFFDDPDDEEDEIYEISGFKEHPYILDYPEDTTSYYVTITDGVCPETPSAVTEVDVLQEIPTAFTPFVKDGYNDVFMERHHVIIYDRYGQKVFVGDDGWPGTHKGHQADPGVYFYELVMGNGLIIRGTIEVVKID